MQLDIQHKLKAIIDQHSHDVVHEHRRVKALLTDYFPHNKREVRVLMMALEDGIVSALLQEGRTISTSVLVNKYSQQLHDEFGVDLTLARWAVETWVIAVEKPKPTRLLRQTASPMKEFTEEEWESLMRLSEYHSFPVLKSMQPPTPKPTVPSNKVLIGDRYIDNQDGTVTDTKTGLQWQCCAVGQTWNGSTCIGEAKRYEWDNAIGLASNFAGKTDWRLPTIDELKSLVLKGKTPTIHEQAFPNTPPGEFWSSSPYAYDSYYAWGVHFGYGFGNGSYRGSYCHARMVRGGQ